MIRLLIEDAAWATGVGLFLAWFTAWNPNPEYHPFRGRWRLWLILWLFAIYVGFDIAIGRFS